MNIIGNVDPEKFLNWCKSQSHLLTRESWNGRQIKQHRDLVWYGLGVNFGSNSIFTANPIPANLNKRLREFYPDFNCLQLLRYTNKADLPKHCDRPVFDKKVIIINHGTAVFWQNKHTFLKNGAVYEIDASIEHAILQTEGERWSLSIRKIIT